jgi:hypothetical protein
MLASKRGREGRREGRNPLGTTDIILEGIEKHE